MAGGLKNQDLLCKKLSGFDTHSTQAVATDTSTGTHANLLAQLADSIKAFRKTLKFLGVQDRVVGVTYSEFGRRIKSNASLGTDLEQRTFILFWGKSQFQIFWKTLPPFQAQLEIMIFRCNMTLGRFTHPF
ncbi:MAG: DUF1501 domain-containing protein [Cytophagaceae bacterium]|nr:DUF1501 domain-containing protein [Cytophagaceae bacterium]